MYTFNAPPYSLTFKDFQKRWNESNNLFHTIYSLLHIVRPQENSQQNKEFQKKIIEIATQLQKAESQCLCRLVLSKLASAKYSLENDVFHEQGSKSATISIDVKIALAKFLLLTNGDPKQKIFYLFGKLAGLAVEEKIQKKKKLAEKWRQRKQFLLFYIYFNGSQIDKEFLQNFTNTDENSFLQMLFTMPPTIVEQFKILLSQPINIAEVISQTYTNWCIVRTWQEKTFRKNCIKYKPAVKFSGNGK